MRHLGLVCSGVLMLTVPAGAQEKKSEPHLVLPSPVAPPIRKIEELGESPQYYRAPEAYRGADLRLALGAAKSFSGENSFGKVVEGYFMGRIGLGRGDAHWGLWPELGYSLNLYSGRTLHEILGGMGVGWQEYSYQIGLIPRVVVNPRESGTGLGLRTGLVLEFWQGAIGFELGHQVFRDTGLGEYVHEGRFTVSIGLLHAIGGSEVGKL